MNEFKKLGRRAFLAGTAGAAAFAVTAQAQQAAPPAPAAATPAAAPAATGVAVPPGAKKIAIASPTVPADQMLGAEGANPAWQAFFAELRAQGYNDGQNVFFEKTSGAAFNMVRRLQGNRYNALGVNLARTNPDVVFSGTTFTARGVNATTETIPVVVVAGDLVASGLVQSLERPGGNITGVTAENGAALETRRFDLLREALPQANKVGYLVRSPINSPTPFGNSLISAAQAAAQRLNMQLVPLYIDDVVDDVALDAGAHYRAMFEAKAQGVQAIVVAHTIDLTEYATDFGTLALAAKIPMVTPWRDATIGGGLLSFGANTAEMYRLAARQVGRILKGEKPEAIAVALAEPELTVSARNARALGITVPATVTAKAQEVV